ncbi:unnamed protein product, partial [Phytomonas sp. Hart1]
MGRTIASQEDQLRRGMETLQETRLALERLKGQAETTEKTLQVQLVGMSEKANHHQEEAERYGRQLEAKESALLAATTALNTLKDSSTLANSTLRDQITAANASISVFKEDNERLKYELKQVQLKHQETQSTLSQEVAALRLKIEEYQTTAQTNWQHLRDKEEEIRRLDLIHDKMLKEQKYEHASAMEALCRSKDAELQSTLSRLERCQAELMDHTGGKKSLSQDLERYAERTRQLKEKLISAQSSLASREEMIAGLKRSLEDANGKLFQQDQRHAADVQAEAQLRHRMEEVERDRAEGEKALVRVETTVAARDAIVRKLEETIAKLQENAQIHQTRLQMLDRQVVEQQEAEMISRRELASRERDIETLRHRLGQVEAQMEEGQKALKQAQQHTEDARNAVKVMEDETRRLRGDLEGRSAEFKRTAEHAKEIEELARRKSEELRQALETRDEAITTMQRERAAILPRLNEEESKNLVLQEKLQHQKELEQLTVSGLQERIADLELTLQSNAMEMEAAKALQTDLREQIDQFQAQMQTQRGEFAALEKKYLAYKDELRKAHAAHESDKAGALLQGERQESERAALHARCRAFKKEKAKMAAWIAHLEEKLHLSTTTAKAGQERECGLLNDLKASEAALATLRASSPPPGRLANSLKVVRGVEGGGGNFPNNAPAGFFHPGLFIRPADYAGEALAMKSAWAGLLLGLHREMMEEIGGYFRQVGKELTRMGEVHRVELTKLREAHRVELTRLRESHRAELAELAESREAELFESHRTKEDAMAGMGARHRADFTKLREDHRGELRRVEEAHRAELTTTKEDHRAELTRLRESHRAELAEVAASREAALLESRRAKEAWEGVKGEVAPLRRRLADAQAEGRHHEDDLRELRAELTALQRVCSPPRAEIAKPEEGQGAPSRAFDELRQAHDAANRELRRLQRYLAGQKERMDGMAGEIRRAQAAEAAALARDQALRSELSALRERCANLESLNHIGEAALTEAGRRERGLSAKLAELRSAQEVMQVCFDKQQEQIEVGRRLREQGSE